MHLVTLLYLIYIRIIIHLGPTIPDLHIFQILLLIHKFFYHKEKLPVIFKSHFNENFLFRNYDTRNRDNLHVHLVRCNTSYGSKSVNYKCSNLWNQLPNDLKLTASHNSFKSKLKLTLAPLAPSHN